MINILKSNLSHEIPRHLFAHNLEHTRACVYGGLSAQIFKNRKFAGKCGRTGVCYDWEGIGADENYFCLDHNDAYTRHAENEQHRYWLERFSQKFQRVAGRCGLRQTGVALREGTQYEFAAVLKTDRAVPFTVRFINAAGETAFLSEFTCDSADWKKYKIDFTSRLTGEDLIFEIYTEVTCETAVGAFSLLPADNFYGMRRDVVEELRNLGTTMLRWPGGNFAGEYRWRDGLLDRDMRAPLCSYMTIETQPYMYGFDNHEIGIDEFAALCRELGAEPFITMNISWETEECLKNLLEYANGGPDTPYGAQRAKRGSAEPYNVKYWSLGNEMGYGHMEGLNSAEAYTAKALSVAAEMKKLDPDIIFCASGPYPNADWVRHSLAKLKDFCGYAAYHSYMPLPLPFKLKFTGENEIRETLGLLANGPYITMRDIFKFRGSIDETLGENEMKISFDEWNAWFAWFRNPSPGEGIFAGVMLNGVMRASAAAGMPLCCYFQPVNEGAIDVSAFDAKPTNIGKVFGLFTRHAGGRAIDLEGFAIKDPASAAVSINNLEKSGSDIFASYNENTGEIIVTCVNKTFDDIALDFSFEGFGGARPSEAKELAADGLVPGRKLEHRDARIVNNEVSLKKHSLLLLVFKTE